MAIASDLLRLPVMRMGLEQLEFAAGLFDNVVWSVPEEGLTESYVDLARQEFERFVMGYTDRLREFLAATRERAPVTEPEAGRAEELSTPATAAQPARAQIHFDRNVAPRFASARDRLAVSTLAEVAAMRSVADVLLGIADSLTPDSPDMEHWLFSAGRQYVETLEAKRLVGDIPSEQSNEVVREDVPLTQSAHMEHALAA